MASRLQSVGSLGSDLASISSLHPRLSTPASISILQPQPSSPASNPSLHPKPWFPTKASILGLHLQPLFLASIPSFQPQPPPLAFISSFHPQPPSPKMFTIPTRTQFNTPSPSTVRPHPGLQPPSGVSPLAVCFRAAAGAGHSPIVALGHSSASSPLPAGWRAAGEVVAGAHRGQPQTPSCTPTEGQRSPAGPHTCSPPSREPPSAPFPLSRAEGTPYLRRGRGWSCGPERCCWAPRGKPEAHPPGGFRGGWRRRRRCRRPPVRPRR